MHYDGLILDFGEVLSYPQQEKDVAAMANVLHVDEARFRDAYWLSRREYDLGLPADEVELTRVHDDVGACAHDVDEVLSCRHCACCRRCRRPGRRCPARAARE